ncbi:hypothetical protein ACWDRX_06460 [Streptomyces nigra]
MCSECRRDIAVAAGRFARHDPPGAWEHGQLVSCPGSRRPVGHPLAKVTLRGSRRTEIPRIDSARG